MFVIYEKGNPKRAVKLLATGADVAREVVQVEGPVVLVKVEVPSDLAAVPAPTVRELYERSNPGATAPKTVGALFKGLRPVGERSAARVAAKSIKRLGGRPRTRFLKGLKRGQKRPDFRTDSLRERAYEAALHGGEELSPKFRVIVSWLVREGYLAEK